jgi:hypothetical protein
MRYFKIVRRLCSRAAEGLTETTDRGLPGFI